MSVRMITAGSSDASSKTETVLSSLLLFFCSSLFRWETFVECSFGFLHFGFIVRAAFRNHLAKEYSLENLRFYRDAVAFKKKYTDKAHPEVENSSEEMKKEARLLFLKHVVDQCPYDLIHQLILDFLPLLTFLLFLHVFVFCFV